MPQYDQLCEHVEGIVTVESEHEEVDFERTDESNRRYDIRRALSSAFVSLKGKFGMTDAGVVRNYSWVFNETLRAEQHDTGPPFVPPGLPILPGASTTDPFAEPILSDQMLAVLAHFSAWCTFRQWSTGPIIFGMSRATQLLG